MSNQQLYFALGVPVLVLLFGFTTTVLFKFWQTKALRGDIRGLRGQLDLVLGKIRDLDTRLAVLVGGKH